nr:hypothetical protein [Parabacteroides johnsonii]
MPWPYPPRKRNSEKELVAIQGNWQTNRRSYRLPTDSFPTSKRYGCHSGTHGSLRGAYNTRDVHSKVDSCSRIHAGKQAICGTVGTYEAPNGNCSMAPRRSGSKDGIMHCATLLFLGMVDDATTFAEHVGRWGGSDLKWGRDDDEDNRHGPSLYEMASRMMRPASAKTQTVNGKIA